MFSIRKLTTIVILILCFCQKSLALELVGIAAYEQLKKEYYIGTLYLENKPNSTEEILTASGSKRMTMRISAGKWSARSFSRLWKQGIAINNTPPASDLTNDLLDFSNILKENLIEGDELSITKSSNGKNVTVTLNGVTLMRSSKAQFFEYLVNVWVGSRPPSSEFKKSILAFSNNSREQSLIERFEALQPTKKRKASIVAWTEKPKPAPKVIPKPKPKPKPKVAAKPKPKPRPAPKPVAKKVLPVLPVKKAAISNKVVSADLKPAKPTKKKVNTDYIRADYRWNVLQKIYKDIEYPEWARSFKQEGTVSLTLNVNRDGSIKSIEDNTIDTSKLLINEVKNAVKTQAPYKAIPKELSTNTFNITFEYSFHSDGRMSQLPPKPMSGNGNGSARQLSIKEKKLLQYEYNKAVEEAVKKNLSYPSWALQLKQEGKVAVVLTIDKNGAVVSLKKRLKGRYPQLIQELESAVTRTAPFAEIPPELNTASIVVDIEHEFNWRKKR